MYTYICDFFVCFGSYLFVRALLAKTLGTSTQEGRQKPVVELGLDPSTVARVACSQSFFLAGVDKTVSRVSLYEAYFVRTYR